MSDSVTLNESESEIEHHSLIIWDEEYQRIPPKLEISTLPTSISFLRDIYSGYERRFGDYSDNLEIKGLYQDSLFHFWDKEHFQPIWYKNDNEVSILLIKDRQFDAVVYFNKNNEMKTIELGKPRGDNKFIPLIRFKGLDKDYGKKKYPKPIVVKENL